MKIGCCRNGINLNLDIIGIGGRAAAETGRKAGRKDWVKTIWRHIDGSNDGILGFVWISVAIRQLAIDTILKMPLKCLASVIPVRNQVDPSALEALVG